MSIITLLEIKKLCPDAVPPAYGSDQAIGLDLCSLQSVAIGPEQVTTIRTGIAVKIPEGHYGRIAPRSGLAARHGVQVLGGVIDSDYRGELMILATAMEHVTVNAGDRIAQLIIEKAARPATKVVEQLDDTARGAGGFGSTGKCW